VNLETNLLLNEDKANELIWKEEFITS